MINVKLKAVQAFVRANGMDRRPIDSPRKRIGIVTTGKAYLDVRQALEELGIDERKALDLGLLHRVFPAADFEQEVEC